MDGDGDSEGASICLHVSTCVSVLRRHNLFKITCQQKRANKHLHVFYL